MKSLLKLREQVGEIEIIKNGEWYMPNVEELKKFDLDLQFGEKGEEFVREVLQGNGKIEVKTERDEGKPKQWKSQTWVHLLSDDGNIKGGFIFDVDYLKDLVKKLVREERAKLTKGGDFNASQLILVPIKELF